MCSCRLRGVYGFCIVALLACLLVQRAGAELIWAIDEPTIIIEELVPENPGPESSFTYNVRNLSTPGDANNLLSFSLTAPTDMRLFYAEGPGENWTHSISPSGNTITFSGNGSYIAPNSSDTFRIFSYNTQTATGTANAISLDNGPFISQSVPIPVIPEPMTLALFALGGGAAWRKRCGGASGRGAGATL